MKFKNVVNKAIDVGITLVSAAAGGTVGAYAINHDIMNDEDLSMIVGSTGAAATYLGTKAALTGIKDNTGVAITKAKEHFTASSKAKADAVS